MHLLLLLLETRLASAADVTGTASGFGELRTLWYAGVDGQQVEVVERFRPTFQATLSEHVRLESTIEVGLSEGRDLQTEFQRTLDASALHDPIVVEGTGPLPDIINPSPWDAAGCAWPDGPINETLHIDGLKDYARVDRLFGDVYLGKADLRVGRQAVQWGNALLVHPADPFPEVLFIQPWKPRSGVNAARLNYQLSDAESVTLLGGTDDTLRYARLAGKVTTNLAQTDVSFIGAWRQEASNGFIGVDVKGTAEVGFWFEGSWHVESAPAAGFPPDRPGTRDDGGYEELAAGIDYSFPIFQQFYLAAQYYRNGAGSTELSQVDSASRFSGQLTLPECSQPGSASLLESSTTTDPFAPVFLGRDYGLFLVQAAFDDRWSANAAMIQNFDDGSALAIPTVGYKPAGWSEFSLSAQLPFSTWGDGGELHPSAASLTPELTYVGGTKIPLDLTGLVPDATVILWTRASF